VSHKGPSVHSGHYVAHVKVPTADDEQGEWVLFNDEKVVRADEESVNELKKLAYLHYVFERAEEALLTLLQVYNINIQIGSVEANGLTMLNERT